MKRFICSAAVASALLAATAIPSGAATIDLTGFSTEPSTVYDDTYNFTLPTTETVSVSGAEFNIASMTLTGLSFSVPTTPTTTTVGSAGSFFGSGSLGPGTYSLVVAGTGGTPVPGNISLYSGFIDTSGSLGPSPVPIPGALALFASGLGLLGFWSRTKGRKAGLGSASLEATAC